MRRLLILLALLLPVTGRACPNILLGDSLAEGMAPYARAEGWEVIARRGAGISWARTVGPRCVGTLVLVIGTNDLAGMTEEVARAYPARVAELVGWWRPRRAVWVLPACFPARPAMERASAWLDAAAGPSGLALSRGRPARCEPIGGDGIHTSVAGYLRWWRGLQPFLSTDEALVRVDDNLNGEDCHARPVPDQTLAGCRTTRRP